MKFFAKYITNGLIHWVDSPKKLRWFGKQFFLTMAFRRHRETSQPPGNVAVIKLDRMGDLVLCSQFLAELRRAWPKARITLFVRESLVDLVRLCRDVDGVIGVPVREGAMLFDPNSREYGSWCRQLLSWLTFCYQHKVWSKCFDIILVPRWDADYYGAVPLAYLMGAAQRWGVTEMATSQKAIANQDFDQLLTHVIKGRSVRHEFLQNESFLNSLGIQPSGNQKLVSWAVEADQKKAADIMSTAGVIASRKIIVICMGAGAETRMWPVESYARLCEAVFDFEIVQLVTIGTTAEKNLGIQLKEMLGKVVINLEGKIPLNLLPAAVSLGGLYLGSDTGTKHLAAMAGLPVFEIACHPLDGEPYWPESPRRFGPWGVPSRVIQPEKAIAPCEKYCAAHESHCIRGVSVEAASAALHSLLEEIGMQNICLDDRECVAK